jgi:hypothetical protein
VTCPPERGLELVASAAYVAYVDGRVADAAVLFGARLGLNPSAFPPRFRPILDALENQGLRKEITAGANLSADEALERVVQLASPPDDLIGRQRDVGGGPP